MAEKEEFLDDWEDPKQRVEQVRFIEAVCANICKIWNSGSGIKAGRDSIEDVLERAFRIDYGAHEASKNLNPAVIKPGGEKHAALRAKVKAAAMLHGLADDIRDGYFPF